MDEITSLLKENWNISATQLEHTSPSTACCYIVHTGDKRYFLKKFQNTHSVAQVVGEAEVCDILLKNGIPVSQIISTFQGNPYLLHQNRIFQLQKYVSGTTPAQNSLTLPVLCQAAEFLGKIHRTLQNLGLPCFFDSLWLKKFQASEYIAFYKDTIAQLEFSEVDEVYKRKIKDDLEFRIFFSEKMDSLSKRFEKLTYTPSHGDYTPSQLICDGNKIVSIVDFANVNTMPAALELIRFYCLASLDCNDASGFNIKSYRQYLAAYLVNYTLTEYDLESMPYIYAYYMGRNRFLYREFIKTGDIMAYDESSRRADLCRYFFENAENISHKLSKIK